MFKPSCTLFRRSCALFAGGAAPFLQETNCADALQPCTPIADALVIGGGVVGVAVARDIAVRGDTVVLLEQADTLISGASSGNSGIGCTGYDAPAGSLERQLLRRSILRHPQLYRSFGLSYDHVNKCGAIVVGWTPKDDAALADTVRENHEAGDTEAERMTAAELYEMEPCLARHAFGAVDVPREVVVEPWLIPIAWAESARLHGAAIHLGQRVVQATRVEATSTEDAHWVVRSETGAEWRGRVLLNCGGLYGDLLERTAGREPWFELEPRKGQFVVYKPHPDHPGPEHVIQQCPSQFSKGVIIWTTVFGLVVVGPTAQPQKSRTDRSTDKETLDMLRATGLERVPALKYATEVCTYSGLRPATEHRDYQIRGDPGQGWITVAGIRSTGLTGASGIAEHVVGLYHQAHPHRQTEETQTQTDPAPPYLPSAALAPTPKHRNATVPTLADLAAQFQKRGDGYIVVFEGQGPMKVTHPLTIAGMKTMSLVTTNDAN